MIVEGEISLCTIQCNAQPSRSQIKKLAYGAKECNLQVTKKNQLRAMKCNFRATKKKSAYKSQSVILTTHGVIFMKRTYSQRSAKPVDQNLSRSGVRPLLRYETQKLLQSGVRPQLWCEAPKLPQNGAKTSAMRGTKILVKLCKTSAMMQGTKTVTKRHQDLCYDAMRKNRHDARLKTAMKRH